MYNLGSIFFLQILYTSYFIYNSNVFH